MPYRRVLPRDLFNESKLLKCLGQLVLLIHDGIRWPLRFELEDEEDGFKIEQDFTGPTLFCTNLAFYIGEKEVCVFTPYNSKECFPLMFVTEVEDGEAEVFKEDGSLSQEFTNWLDAQDTQEK